MDESRKPLSPRVRPFLEAEMKARRLKACQAEIDAKLAKVLDDKDFWSGSPEDNETEAEALGPGEESARPEEDDQPSMGTKTAGKDEPKA